MGFFTKVFKFLNGYVTVIVEGFFLEKFTNLCAINTIPFWNIKRYGNAKMIGRTSIKGFKKMRFEAKKCGCRVKIVKKRGTPFFLHRYKKRKIFVCGFLMCLIAINIVSMFVWSVDVSGNENISENEILETLESIGVKKGVLKKSLEVRKLADLFMIKRDDISWVGISVDGIRVNVKVIEKEEVPKKIDEKMACDIVATKPALIVTIDTYQGKPMVESGDIVDRGTILVTGVMEMKQFPERTREVHSLASIKGKVWYEKVRSLKLSKNRTNEEVENFAYKLAYKNIMDSIPKDAEILDISKNVTYTQDKVIVTVTLESIEEIGMEVER